MNSDLKREARTALRRLDRSRAALRQAEAQFQDVRKRVAADARLFGMTEGHLRRIVEAQACPR